MQNSSETHYEDWTIVTSCRENKPDDWKPMDPIPYLAQARIDFTSPHIRPDGWVSKNQMLIPAEGERDFDDWTIAHATLLDESRKLVDTLKK